MEFFLGNKNNLGVEVKIIDRNEHGSLMGNAKLWFGGQFLGTFRDYIYLDGYLLGGAFQMLKTKELHDVNFPSESNAQFDYFLKRSDDLNDNDIDSYRASFGTFTDNFIVWVFRKENKIVILWKLFVPEGGFIHEDLIDCENKIFSYVIDYNEFKDFVERLDRILNVW